MRYVSKVTWVRNEGATLAPSAVDRGGFVVCSEGKLWVRDVAGRFVLLAPSTDNLEAGYVQTPNNMEARVELVDVQIRTRPAGEES